MLSIHHFPGRTFVIALLVLLVAACSGGGCSSGCAQCGTTPLANGFPKPETIPNSAHVRVTRPGLDFLQANLSVMGEKALGGNAKGGVTTFPIPKSTQSGFTICPPANPVSPQCEAEIDIGKAKLRINAITPNRVKLDGTLPVRIRDLPVSISFFNAYVVAGDRAAAPNQDLCTPSLKGAATFPYKEFPLNVELPLVTETRPPRTGYTKLDVDGGIIDIAITKNDLEICDGTCGGFCQGFLDAIKDIAFNALINGVKGQIKDALGSAFCTAPAKTVNPPCPQGSEPNDKDLAKADKCVFTGTQECVPSLLGTDGHMELGAALAGFSPGTQGGLDFVLASAGDMAPKPSTAGAPPAWTPRKPPVPAEDNNKNGISLTMLGGAVPKPISKCIVDVDRTGPPQGIPIPKELEGDTITGWPAGTPGPHIGLALAGRWLDHVFRGAYNSGALCLGVSTAQVDLLSSGYLSLLTPSIKTLTFEQQTAAAAITTRPSSSPKITIGNGTDVEADPLLTITLNQFAVDFYVFSFDRYVRLFTYTADVAVPLNLQTGKDDKNPNGGILPVIGDLEISNPSVTNNSLLQEDDARIKDGVTGLLGGIVGSFLGGGLSAIDIQSALASAGLGLDIPAGGIRKITSGTDDFIGIFANLKLAASTALEEADTKAVIVEKIVDRERMGLATAERKSFPKLRVRVDGIASRPTEHTWWVDNGPHAAWTTKHDVVVDQDAMLLQGKHVLHVSARVIGDLASEDATPVAIPFVIDTLPPRIDVTREGNKVDVKGWDFVSANDALRMRYRIGANGAWSEWAPVAAFETSEENVAIELSDEEGNVGSVQLPLRGVADPTLAAAGSGCGCRTVPSRSTSSGIALAALAGLALALRARRNRTAL